MIKVRTGLAALVAAAMLWPATAVADPPANFIDFETGVVPIVITAPHGGSFGVSPSDIEADRTDDGDNVLLNDYRTDDIAHRLADLLEACGLKPYLVVNQIDRRRIDMNRDKTAKLGAAAFEDPDAEAYYDFYHGKVTDYVSTVFNTYGGGILLDIHGQAEDNTLVFRGTRNGETVEDMLNDHGEAALTGPSSIFGQLDTLGYLVDPANNEPINTDPEDTFIGGYTVKTYGSHQPMGIDAIQIEYGRNYRDLQNNALIWQTTADDLATAVKAYYDAFIVPEPASGALLLAGVGLVARRRRPRGAF